MVHRSFPWIPSFLLLQTLLTLVGIIGQTPLAFAYKIQKNNRENSEAWLLKKAEPVEGISKSDKAKEMAE